jgi:hypothetical protein
MEVGTRNNFRESFTVFNQVKNLSISGKLHDDRLTVTTRAHTFKTSFLLVLLIVNDIGMKKLFSNLKFTLSEISSIFFENLHSKPSIVVFSLVYICTVSCANFLSNLVLIEVGTCLSHFFI